MAISATAPTATAERDDRLAAAVSRLRTGAGSGNYDRAMLIVGGVLLPFGLVLILLGWYGASHTTLAFEQTSYLISGGLLGLGLVFAGGFVYFAYWITRLVRDGREQNERLLRETREQAELVASALERIEELLATPARPVRPVRARQG